MSHKFETHAHTSEGSPCAMVPARQVIEAYKKSGYSGIVITDHISRWSTGIHQGSWEDKINQIKLGWEIALNEGQKLELPVFLGFEITIDSTGRDFLIYADNYDFLYRYENIFELSLEELFSLSKQHNFIIIAAHPFRNHDTPPDAQYLHGAEIHNGNKRHANDNQLAENWMNNTHLIALSGSDFHEYGDITSGITLNHQPVTMNEFISALKRKAFKIIAD